MKESKKHICFQEELNIYNKHVTVEEEYLGQKCNFLKNPEMSRQSDLETSV